MEGLFKVLSNIVVADNVFHGTEWLWVEPKNEFEN